MFYAISFLMVIVYAYEVNRTIRGWRVTPVTALQERRRCTERAQHCLPYVLAWLLPALTFLAQLLLRGASVRDIAPMSIEPVLPRTANHSRGADSLYCSSCLILIHHSQDVCYKVRAPRPLLPPPAFSWAAPRCQKALAWLTSCPRQQLSSNLPFPATCAIAHGCYPPAGAGVGGQVGPVLTG
ncbi:hypothetical protein DR999_PMT22583 [Platysternon megacephalum]|uniref:Uncharacterized protein n=1 Tax=Platysternon megacephalum TaxID=55544 RepID=A0A4D9DH26_9SAUR|nr:hypothetical protein DR999_PMT22583 [Platysternon megacephalum]